MLAIWEKSTEEVKTICKLVRRNKIRTQDNKNIVTSPEVDTIITPILPTRRWRQRQIKKALGCVCVLKKKKNSIEVGFSPLLHP